jgi:hypothetical protein
VQDSHNVESYERGQTEPRVECEIRKKHRLTLTTASPRNKPSGGWIQVMKMPTDFLLAAPE